MIYIYKIKKKKKKKKIKKKKKKKKKSFIMFTKFSPNFLEYIILISLNFDSFIFIIYLYP